jgi:spectrin beta
MIQVQVCQFLVAADKVHKKAENINERRNANRDRALQQMDKLKDQLQLHQFLQVR